MTYDQDAVDRALFLARQSLPPTALDGFPLLTLGDRAKRRQGRASSGAPAAAMPAPSSNIRHRTDVSALDALRETMIRHGYAAGGAPAAPVTVDDFMRAAGGQSASPPFPSGGGIQVATPQQPTAPPPFSATGGLPMVGASPAPARPLSDGTAPPPFPATGGVSVADFMANSSPMPGAARETAPSQQQSPGLLKSAAAGAMSGVQDVADAAKWMWDNASAPGLGELSAADDAGVTTENLMPKPSTSAQIPFVTKFVQNNQPQTLGEKMAYGAGSMLPFAAAQLVPGAGEAADASALGKLATRVRGFGTMLGAGATSGAGEAVGQSVGQDVGGQTGGEIGGTIGALTGGLLPSASGYALSKVAEGLGDVAPVTQGLKNQQARRWLTDQAGEDLPAIRQTVAARLTPGATMQSGNRSIPLGPNGEILSGAAPSVAQLSGSGPLARLEEALKTQPYGADLNDLDSAHAAARGAALRNIGPADGDPATLGEFVTKALADQDARYQRQMASENQNRDAALAQQPGAAGEIAPYQAGQQFQGALSAGDTARKQAVDNLFSSLRQRNPVLDVSPLRQTTSTIEGNILASKAGDVSDSERQLYARAGDLAASPDTTWSQVQQLRSEVGNAITDSTGKYGAASPATQRLMTLKNGIDDATASAVDRLPQADPEWAATLPSFFSARISPEDVQRAKQGLEQLSARGRINGAPGERPGAPGIYQAAAAEPAPRGGAGRVGPSGGALRPQGGYDDSQRDPAMAAGERVRWNTSDAATYGEALASHAARKGLYANPQIGPLLAKAPGGNLALAPEQVIKQAVPTGPRGALMARSVAATAADDPNIMSYYESIVGLDLRNAVVRNGQVDRGALASWTRNHQALLSEMPQVAERLTSIDQAQEMVDQAAKSAATARSVYETGALGDLIGGGDPAVAMQTLLSGTPNKARTFMSIVRRNPAAEAGAQRAMSDYLADRLLSPMRGTSEGDEAIKIQGVKSLITTPSKMAIIREVLGPDAPKTLQRVVDSFELHNTGKISRLSANGSRTAPLGEEIKRLSEPRTLMGRAFQQVLRHPTRNAVAVGMAHPLAALPTAMATGAAEVALRNSQESVARLVALALRDPRAFLKLTTPIPKGATAEARFMRQARGVLANAALQSASSQRGSASSAN